MAFTFKKTLENMQIGSSLFDAEGSALCARIVEKAKAKGVQLHFPVDYVTADKVGIADAEQGRAAGGIPPAVMLLRWRVWGSGGGQFDAAASVGAADDASGIPEGWMGLDIGPKSTAACVFGPGRRAPPSRHAQGRCPLQLPRGDCARPHRGLERPHGRV